MNRFSQTADAARGLCGASYTASGGYPVDPREAAAKEASYANQACPNSLTPSAHEIPMALGDLDSALNQLFELVNALVGKLSPALRNEPSASQERSKDRGYSTDLGGRLGSLRRSIDSVHDTLQDAIGRLEL